MIMILIITNENKKDCKLMHPIIIKLFLIKKLYFSKDIVFFKKRIIFH